MHSLHQLQGVIHSGKLSLLKVSHLSQRYVTVHDRETFDQILLFSESAGLCKGSADRGDGG